MAEPAHAVAVPLASPVPLGSSLPAAALRRTTDPAEIPFATTADAEVVAVIGQERAREAIRFGVAMAREGYNLFAMGPPGTGKHTLVEKLLAERAAAAGAPSDWCYVYDFLNPAQPRALALPAGRGATLRALLTQAATELRTALPALFDSQEYRTGRRALDHRFKELKEKASRDLEAEAAERDVAVLRTDTGLAVAPLQNGLILSPEAFHKLPEDQQARYETEREAIEGKLHALFEQFHRWDHEENEAVQALEEKLTTVLAVRLLAPARGAFEDLPPVLQHLGAIQRDIVRHAAELRESLGDGATNVLSRLLDRQARLSPLHRYEVNLLVDNGTTQGAPVVYEPHPSFPNLLGRVSAVAELGTLVTDFTLIKAGALHRANGGYLLLDALKLLVQPFAWDGLKRALRAGQIRVEQPGASLGLAMPVTLEPEPIPLDVKVVLMGERPLYYLLAELDADFPELFKVLVDFDDAIDRDAANQALYAGALATLAGRDRLRAFDRAAVARVVDEAARHAEDARKLSLHMRAVLDLMREADACAGTAGREVVTAADVEAAVAAKIGRAERVRSLHLEAIRRGLLLIDVGGAQVGQVNGLSVARFADLDLGQPTRITARVRVGTGDVVDIEREVELGGPIHSKGVLILAGYLGERYASDAPLSLAASIVFEQSYAAVEGDSASLAELCALLSALARIPIRQSLAVTGSVSQHGQVQPVGAVEAKVEGFFDACRARGPLAGQGVIIPRANVERLMLRPDVVAAVAAGEFHVFAVEHVDQALQLLTGVPAGARGDDGAFTPASFNARVAERLATFAAEVREFARLQR